MADDDPYLIKRYSNRKLYDSVRRRFTTLDEIAALVDSGVRILVRDHDIGTDRTDEVLAQVLRRRAQSRPGSSSLLADLLRAPTEVAGSVVGTVAGQAGIADGAGSAAAAAASAGRGAFRVPDDAVRQPAGDDLRGAGAPGPAAGSGSGAASGGAADASGAAGESTGGAGSGANSAGKKPGEKKPGEKKAGVKKPKKAKVESGAADGDGDRRDAEIRELRDQVSQLTQAVTLLLKDKADGGS